MRLSRSQGAAEAQCWWMQEGGRWPASSSQAGWRGDIPFEENQNSRRGPLKLLSLWSSPRLLTLASRLNGDLLAAVAPAGGGDGSYPQQVLLPTVQVGNPVEELLWTRLILAGSLWGRGQEVLRAKALGPPASNSNLPRDRVLRGNDGQLGMWKGRQDPAYFTLSGFGATGKRICTGLGPGSRWACSALLPAQPQFTSLIDPSAGNCCSRPGNVSILGGRWKELGEGRM